MLIYLEVFSENLLSLSLHLPFCVPTICKIVTAVSSMMISFKYIIEKKRKCQFIFFYWYIDFSLFVCIYIAVLHSKKPQAYCKAKTACYIFKGTYNYLYRFYGNIACCIIDIGYFINCIRLWCARRYFRTSAILLGINFISTLCEFIFFLASCKLTKGIKYSLSSVFITKAGAKATAVSGFVYAVISVISSVIGYMFISGSIDALFYFANQISGTLERSGVNFSSNFVNNSELLIQ